MAAKGKHPPIEFVQRCGLCNTPLFMFIRDFPIYACPLCGWEMPEHEISLMEDHPNEQYEGQDHRAG